MTRLRLTGLSEPEVAAHLAGVTGWAVPASVAAAVCRRTQGNPFFVGELGRVLASSWTVNCPRGYGTPCAIDSPGSRPPAVTWSRAAAVLGSDVDPVAARRRHRRPTSSTC